MLDTESRKQVCFSNPLLRIADTITPTGNFSEEFSYAHNSKYDGIILDPPSFGRGVKNEVFNIETNIYELLDLSKKLLSSKFSFIIFSCHTPGFTKNVLKNFLIDVFQDDASLEIDELLINSEKSYSMPSGFYAIWKKNGNRN